MIAILVFVIFVFCFGYACARQNRLVREQRRFARAVEALVWRSLSEDGR
jgi:hypothetical protein